jgi:hypothetical protein
MKDSSEWQGTKQHGNASDLSRWLVHLTRSEEDLISILKSGRIEARSPYGAGARSFVRNWHRSVCLTEIPLNELGRMTTKRPWGIVFDKERLRAKFNAQPVWYVSDPSLQWDALNAAMQEARGKVDSPIWKLTPFIDRVGSLQSQSPNDWRWEREWRVRGNLDFDLADVARIVVDNEGGTDFFEEISVGVPWVSPPEFTVRWSGGFTEGWNDEIVGMLDRFHEQFVAGGIAGVHWDREDQDYFSMVPILETVDAMDEAFGYLAPELQKAVEEALSRTDTLWCRLYDLSLIND